MLGGVTAAVYGQVVGFDFLILDDMVYVTQNAHVQNGLSWEGFAWAFKTRHAAYWHPLTWLSHMLDCELYGLRPAGHHASNLALHVINAMLLFGLLRAATRRVWPSAFVAGLFALHPFHVESVAWISERKDVLSTCLGLTSIWFYVGFARGSGLVRYGLAAMFLALGLTAKAMLVTLPFVFMLLDYWPLKRVGRWRAREFQARVEATSPTRPRAPRHRSMIRLLCEKIPFLLMSAASCVVTFIGQQGDTNICIMH